MANTNASYAMAEAFRLQEIINNLASNTASGVAKDSSQDFLIQQLQGDVDDLHHTLMELTNITTGNTTTDEQLKSALILLQSYFNNGKLKLSNFSNNNNTYSFLITDTDSNVKWITQIPTSVLNANSNINMGPLYEILQTKAPSGTNSLTNKFYVDGAIQVVADRVTTIENSTPTTVTYNEYNEDTGTWTTVTKIFSNLASAWTFVSSTLPTAIRYGRMIYEFLNGTRQFPNIRSYTQLINEVDDLIGDVADQTRIVAVEGRLTTAETNITSITTRLTTAEGNITSITTRITASEGNITSLTTRVTALEARDLVHDTGIASANSLATSANALGVTNSAEIASIYGILSALGFGTIANGIFSLFGGSGGGSDLGDLPSRISDCEDRLDDAEDAISSNAGAIGGLTISLGTTNTNVTAVSNRVTTLENKSYLPTFNTTTNVDANKVLSLYYDNVTNPAVPVTKTQFALIKDANISDVAYSKITGAPAYLWPASTYADAQGNIKLGGDVVGNVQKYTIYNVREPSIASDVTTKNYVDNKVPTSMPINNITATTITDSAVVSTTLGRADTRFRMVMGNGATARVTNGQAGLPSGKTSYCYGDSIISINGWLNCVNYPTLGFDCASKQYVDDCVANVSTTGATKTYVDDQDLDVYETVHLDLGYWTAPYYGQPDRPPCYLACIGCFDVFTRWHVQTTNTNAVYRLCDRSLVKSGNFYNPTDAQRPTINDTGMLAEMVFNKATPQFLINPSLSFTRNGMGTSKYNGFTCFVVFKVGAFDTYQSIVSGDQGYSYRFGIDARTGPTHTGVYTLGCFAGANGNIRFKRSNGTGADWIANTNTWYSCCFAYTPKWDGADVGQNQQIYLNAWVDTIPVIVNQICTTMADFNPSGCSIGINNGFIASPIEPFGGSIKTVIFYDGPINPSMRDKIFDYLKYRYGLGPTYNYTG